MLNLTYYVQYMQWIRGMDLTKLKFVDECHFQAKGTSFALVALCWYEDQFLTQLFTDYWCRKACGPRGSRVVLTRPGQVPKACSITLLTSLHPDSTCTWTTRYGSNCQVDFITTIRQFVECGVLEDGDVLVLDNASVHTGRTHQQDFQELLQEAGVSLVWLPKYSPELNPCEFVFARIKHFIRSPQAVMFDQYRGQEVLGGFQDLLFASTSLISYESMQNTYQHCASLDPDSHIGQVLIERNLVEAPP